MGMGGGFGGVRRSAFGILSAAAEPNPEDRQSPLLCEWEGEPRRSPHENIVLHRGWNSIYNAPRPMS